jgi:hypothetical protein
MAYVQKSTALGASANEVTCTTTRTSYLVPAQTPWIALRQAIDERDQTEQRKKNLHYQDNGCHTYREYLGAMHHRDYELGSAEVRFPVSDARVGALLYSSFRLRLEIGIFCISRAVSRISRWDKHTNNFNT